MSPSLLWIALAILIQPISTGAQARVLQGIVVDSVGQPIARAMVMSANAVTETGVGGRFRITVPDAGSCLLDVLQRGFQRARLLFDVCPDTMLRVILRRATARTPSFEDLRDRCGTRATQPCSDPQNIRFIAISSGQSHACGIAADSSAWCWGDGRNGQLGDSRREVSRFPQRVPGDQRFVSMAAGGKFTCSRTAHGEVVCWGDERTVPGWPQQAAGPVLVRLPEPATSLTAGRRHACVLNAVGQASCWGWNVDGETGIGSSGIAQPIVPHPTPVATDARFTSLSAGFGFTCGVTSDAGVMCWGSNVDHILGPSAPERCGDIAPVPCSSRPLAIALPERMIQVSSGTAHACALSERGTVQCWGANFAGQAGVFRTGAASVPAPALVELPAQARAVALSSGGIQTCALTSTQLAYCWGADNLNFGQDVARSDEMRPRVAASGLRLRTVSVGQVHICALDMSNRLRCWGDTTLGRLGVR